MKGLQNQLDMSLKEVEVLKESRERQMNMVCINDIYYCIIKKLMHHLPTLSSALLPRSFLINLIFWFVLLNRLRL